MTDCVCNKYFTRLYTNLDERSSGRVKKEGNKFNCFLSRCMKDESEELKTKVIQVC